VDRNRSDRQAGSEESDTFDPQRDYDQSLASDELRAYHGNIFFARVDSLEGEEKEHLAEGLAPHRVLRYLATVDRSLAGKVAGQVLIVYYGAYDESFESAGFGPLRIGERYLFFAGSDEARTEFYVQAGSGTILITDAQRDKELVDKYTPLIAEAEEHEKNVIARSTAWEAARAARAGTVPQAAISPEQGPPGTAVAVTGQNFAYNEVTIPSGGDAKFAEVRRADGSFEKAIEIPKNAPDGPFEIVVDDQEGFKTKVDFTVTR
jgi:hypothetical protein